MKPLAIVLLSSLALIVVALALWPVSEICDPSFQIVCPEVSKIVLDGLAR